MIKEISLKNFRNYDDLKIQFTEKINIIVGDNGLGKTNLIESIFTLMFTKSFKSIKEIELITQNQDYFRLEGIINNNTKSIYYNQDGKKVFVNSLPIKKISDYIKDNKVIFYGPDEVFLIKGTPYERRKYYDFQISQYNQYYLYNLNAYRKILKLKNRLLKNDNIDLILLDVYNKELAKYIEYIEIQRENYINLINEKINNYWQKYYPNTKISIKRKKIIQDDSPVINILNEIKNKEIKYHKTLYGPHLEDFVIYYNQQKANIIASEGQIKLMLLSLKLTELSILSVNGNKPIILLDDLFSELDQKNSNKLLNELNINYQIIITTANIQLINKDLLLSSNIIKINEKRNKKNEQ